MPAIARPPHGTIRAPACSATVVGFGSFRGDADGGDGARLGGVAPARAARSRRRRRAVGFLALVIALTALPAWAQTPPSATERSAAAVAARQPGNAAALSTAGPGDAACESSAADQHLHRAVAHRRDAELRQSQWLRRRRHRLRFHQHAKKQKKKTRCAERRTPGRKPSTTFAPVPTFALPHSAASCRHRKIRRRPRSIRRMRRDGPAPSCRRCPTNCRSAIRRLKCIRWRPPTGPARNLPVPPVAIFRLFGHHAAADVAAAQHLPAGNAAATAAADREATIRTRPSASAPARFCCCHRSICQAATAPIPGMGRRPARHPRISSRRRSCKSPRTGSAIR